MSAKPAGPLRIGHQGDGVWSGKITLPLMAALRIGAPPAARRRRVINIEGYGGASVNDEQRAAIEFLTTHEPAVLEALLSALSQQMGLATGKVREVIRIESITLPGEARDRRAYVEIHGNCARDVEHGFRVVMHGLRVVDVGTAMSSWSDDPAVTPLTRERLIAMGKQSQKEREDQYAQLAATDPVLRQKMDENERYRQELKELGPEAATARALERARAMMKAKKSRRRA